MNEKIAWILLCKHKGRDGVVYDTWGQYGTRAAAVDYVDELREQSETRRSYELLHAVLFKTVTEEL